MSVKDTVQINSNAHHHPLPLKLRVINKKRNKYKGAQNADSRVKGRILSKKEFVQSPFTFMKSHWSHAFNCSNTDIAPKIIGAKISMKG